MKKILLLTIEDYENFGNRLQHFALQRKIELYGFTVSSLMLKADISPIKLRLKNIAKALMICGGIEKYRSSLGQSKRCEKILFFNKHYFSHIVRILPEQLCNTNWSCYDYAVTGSDQVWHNWHNKSIPDELPLFYLEFIETSKRVSYAPSFGFKSFPPEDVEKHRHGLMEMRALSCREQDGCELIRVLTGREAQKVLDPTLLLTEDEWSEVEKKPHFKLPDRYLLYYFLGDATPEYQTEIKRIADARCLQIININDKTDPIHYAIGPGEFIWLIHHADTICTDSFHASVFSITFKRNLRAFRREQTGFKNMFGRLQDLLEPLGLMSLVFGDGDGLSTILSEEAKEYLSVERETSLRYLKESLEINEN